ncbi:MAG: hypothetical protein ABR953_13015 [Candidatus Acidiferrales bacterium]
MGEKRNQPSQLSFNISLKGAQAIVTALVTVATLCFSPPFLAQQEGPLPPAPPQEEIPASPPRAIAPQPAPQPPATPPDSKHFSSGISKEPPALPVDQIIQKFAEREAEFREERDNFTYVQDFVVQTIDADGRSDGEYRMTSDITFTPSGKRYEEITYAPPPTLERISLSEQDLDDLKNVQPFVLTTAEVPKYDISYVGREKLDEIGTYVFDVGPKKIEKNQRYFQGRIWVDDKDLEIVKTYGKAVPDIRKGNSENVFPRFETFRENIESHYWFPTYTYADDILHFRSDDVHIRMTVHYSDYKRFRVSIRLRNTEPPTQAHP